MGNGKFCWRFFLLGGGNLTRSDFDHLNLFQNLNQHSVHIDHQLKWYGSCEHSLKWSFYQVLTWILLCSRGIKVFGESLLAEEFFLVGRWINQFLASGWGFCSIQLVRKTLQFLSNFSQNIKNPYLMIHCADLF